MEDLRKLIRDVPDFPKKGIIFKDITTLLKDAAGLKKTIDKLAGKVKGMKIDKVAAVESRGFILGAPLAVKLGAGFVPIRKKGKLPSVTVSQTYDLEYGTDTLEIHSDSIKPNEKILIVDDLLATGGTAGATAALVKKLKGKITAILFLVELEFLNGREKLKDYMVHSLIKYK